VHEACDELADKGARIGTLEGKIQEFQATIGERDVMLVFLGDQLHDLLLDLDDAQGSSTSSNTTRLCSTLHPT
jgi:hypothetical protein